VAQKVVIVGGGITGAFAAFFLSRLGAQATIVERGELGGQASSRNAGHLNPLHGAGIPGPLQPLALFSHRLHLEHWGELRRLSRLDFTGGVEARLQPALDEADVAMLGERGRLYNATPGFAARWVEPGDLRGVEPRLRNDLAGALITDGAARVEPGAYTRAVVAAAVALGAEVARAEVVGLGGASGRIDRVQLDADAIACDAVVIATGAWCAAPAAWLGLPLPVEPVRGELLVVEPSSGPPLTGVTWRQFGVDPVGAGRIRLGGTEDRAGFDDTPTASGRERILTAARELLPGMGELRVLGHSAGLRPVSRDGLPIAGVAPSWENVFLAVGPGRKGMLLSAGLGLAAAETLTAGATSVPIADCSPDRDALRAEP
jgi:glycine oxidase